MILGIFNQITIVVVFMLFECLVSPHLRESETSVLMTTEGRLWMTINFIIIIISSSIGTIRIIMITLKIFCDKSDDRRDHL